jgi:glycosyltransferase involved in cell wall biosynthesis
MRFVFLSTMAGAPWGGSEELWSQAALRLRHAGEHVAVSVPWWPQLSPKITALARQGVEVRLRGRPPTRIDRARQWFGRQPNALPEEMAWVRQQRPDVIVISQGGNADGWEWMTFCRNARLPFVVIVQCNYEEWWPTDESRGALEACYLAAKAVYCVSRQNLELLQRQIGSHLPNAAVVWNPSSVLSDRPPAWPTPNHVHKLACVARLEPAAKGQDLLFQVLTCRQWRERPVEINLYGRGTCEKTLEQLARYLQLANVRFRGYAEDVRSIWAENHLFILPSRYEGLPLALVEAMLCERPAVVTEVGGNTELCVNEETGFVAAAPTVSCLGNAMERAWARREDWQAMGSAARARAEQLVPRDPVGAFCRELLAGI